jgi:hypothetical protein
MIFERRAKLAASAPLDRKSRRLLNRCDSVAVDLVASAALLFLFGSYRDGACHG